jgi:hypothetical protein
MEFSEILKSTAKIMATEFAEITKQIKHRGKKGRTRETIVEKFLYHFLPKKYSVGTGEIVSSNGQVTKQQDVVIYGEFNSPMFYNNKEIIVFPAECIYATIEVKSNLNESELIKSIENIISVKTLKRDAYLKLELNSIQARQLRAYYREFFDYEGSFFPIYSCIFAYDSIKLETLAKYLNAYCVNNKIGIHHRVDSIIVLNKGIIANYDNIKKQYFERPSNSTALCFFETPRESLLFFYEFLWTSLILSYMHKIDISKYLCFRRERDLKIVQIKQK